MFYSPEFPRRRQQASALIIVLALVVIVSTLLVAMITSVQLDRTATASYSQSLAAEQIAQGGLRLLIADLQNEMAADQPPDLTYPKKPLFTNVTSTNILPQRIGALAAMPNLVRTSTTDTYKKADGTPMAGLKASSVSSATPSVNGRYVDVARWNAPYLGEFPDDTVTPKWVYLTRNGPTDAASAVYGKAVANSVNNSSLTNPDYVLGRFSYAVYDESGLLDVTVAGYPTSLTTAELQKLKGTLAGANLSGLGIDADALTQWRNKASAGSGSTYAENVKNYASKKAVYPGDTTFVGRQDLITAAKKNIAGLNPDLLPKLTTFTRERNAPSWSPKTPAGSTYDYAAQALNGLTSTSPSTNTAPNLFVPSVRHSRAGTITSYRIDGSPYTYEVEPGDPLVYRRFPLDRLKWLGPNGPQNGGTDASIRACFGLIWGQSTDTKLGISRSENTRPNVWKYVGSVGTSTTELSSVKLLTAIVDTTLESVEREPNFFELLQAGILSKSLAFTNGDTGTGPTGFYSGHNSKMPLHVFRIGASIISQYENSLFPCAIEYSEAGKPWVAVGIENLPYVNYYRLSGGALPAGSATMANYSLTGLWNPHQQPATAPARPPIRLHIQGTIALVNYYYYDQSNLISLTASPGSPIPGLATDLDETITLSATGAASFTSPGPLSVPDIQTGSLGSVTATTAAWEVLPVIGDGNGNLYGSGSSTSGYVGSRLPDFRINPALTKPAAGETGNYWRHVAAFYGASGAPGSKQFSVAMEFQQPNGAWIPYSFLNGVNNSATWTKGWLFAQYVGYLGRNNPTAVPPAVQLPPLPVVVPEFKLATTPLYGTNQGLYSNPVAYLISDPRSMRLGPIQSGSTINCFIDSPLWGPTVAPAFKTDGYGFTAVTPPPPITAANPYVAMQQQPAICLKPGSNAYFPAWLCRNTPAPTSGYKSAYVDPDGINRIGDSGLFTTTPSSSGWEGVPYARTADRPVILNREFYSVADLGFVSRDCPWRTLDFYTSKSADAGLLDMFTVNSSDESVISGKINLNAQNPAAFQAALNNTLADVMAETPLTKPAELAAKLTTLTAPTSGGQPLLNKEEIATRIVSSLSQGTLGSEFSTTDDQNIKTRREGVARALADVGQTRTWNLMIDLVAQSGRFSPAAKSPEQFVVEGERRYWLHVAIDRFTGEVVDQQLEIVTE